MSSPFDLAVGAARAGLGLTTMAISTAGKSLRAAAAAGREPVRDDKPFLSRELERSERAGRAFAAELLPRFVDGVLDQLDLTRLVKERVDLNDVMKTADLDALTERLDLDAVVTRVNVDAVIDRVDLVSRARILMEQLEIPEIIRESTGALATESVDRLRAQGMRADQLMARIVDRLLRRTGDRETSGPALDSFHSGIDSRAP